MTLPARHPLSVTRVLPCALALAFSQSGHAEEDDQKTTSGHNYLVGAMALSQPDYEGSERRIIKLRPLWAYQWGRFRLSTSRSAAAMNFASDPQGPGASALLVDGNRFRFGGALRFDSGRQSGDSPRLNGLPDVERTLRGASSSGTSSPIVGTSVPTCPRICSADRGSGGEPRSRISQALGPDHCLVRRLRHVVRQPPEPADLLRDHAGAVGDIETARVHGQQRASKHVRRHGVHHVVDPALDSFGNAGASRLLGDPAASPLTGQRSSVSAGLGLAYRCCRW